MKTAKITIGVKYGVALGVFMLVILLSGQVRAAFHWSWLIYLHMPFLFATSVYLLVNRTYSSVKFFKDLKDNEFKIDECHSYGSTYFCIGYTHRQIACNLLTEKRVPFSEVRSCATQAVPQGEDKTRLTMKIGVKVRDGASGIFQITMLDKIVLGRYANINEYAKPEVLRTDEEVACAERCWNSVQKSLHTVD